MTVRAEQQQAESAMNGTTGDGAASSPPLPTSKKRERTTEGVDGGGGSAAGNDDENDDSAVAAAAAAGSSLNTAERMDVDNEDNETTAVTTAVSPSPTKAKSQQQKKNMQKQQQQGQAQVFSPELLRVYYNRLFPYEFLHSWLSYDPKPSTGAGASNNSNGGGSPTFTRREFSFTIESPSGDEIYIRYQSFPTLRDLRTAVIKRNPHKIDIGAVFSHPPKDHNSIVKTKFRTVQRELVFDIDLTDYDGVRLCGCSGAAICRKCWTMMVMAVRVMDAGLRRDFGFKDLAWFYSGRRGVHCWVCDESARELSNEARSAVAAYFEIPHETDKNKNAYLSHPLHPMLARSFDVLEPMFVKHIVPASGHGLLATKANWSMLLDTLPDAAEPVARKLGAKWSQEEEEESDDQRSTSKEKWEELKRMLALFVSGRTKGESAAKKSNKLSSTERIQIELWKHRVVFKYCYPRLDINVSKMQNHLLKSPFCVHPKTGRVCVPLPSPLSSSKNLEEFDPFSVPTVAQVVRELDECGEIEEGDEVDVRRSSSATEWKKTSLAETFESFERDFLIPLKKRLMKEERSRKEERAALAGDF